MGDMKEVLLRCFDFDKILFCKFLCLFVVVLFTVLVVGPSRNYRFVPYYGRRFLYCDKFLILCLLFYL